MRSSTFRPACLVLACALLPAAGARSETLRIVTLDGTGGKPIPARVSVRPSGGEWIGAADRSGRPFKSAGLPRLWSSGRLEVEVPTGPTEVIASRPFARFPARAEVQVAPGSSTELTLELKAVADMAAMGWHGGDAHAHVIHGERHVSMDLATAVAISRAEGLDWVAFGEVWVSEGAQPPPAELTRMCRDLTDGIFLAAWTQEHPKDHLGHMACFPLGVDRTFADAVGENAYAGDLARRESFAHFEILRSLRALGSLAIYTHPSREYGGTGESPANIARELPFDVVAAPWALEGLDVLTDAPDCSADIRLWHFLLNRGLRLAACGFSDTCYDRTGECPGDTRTFAFLGGAPRTMPSIVDAVRRGRTFASTGPLVVFTVDGEPPGAVFPAGEAVRKARVRAWNAVDHRDPHDPALLSKAIVIRSGRPWKEWAAPGKASEAEWTFEIREEEAAWYSVEVHGSSRRQLALTSPVYFERKDRRPPEPARAVVRGKVEGAAGERIDGKAIAVEYGKDRERPVAEAPVVKGAYEIRCPADCRIRIEAPGCRPATKSILMDSDAIYRDLLFPIRRDRLWDPELYREIEKRLGDVQLDFRLEGEGSQGSELPGGAKQ